MPGVKILLLSEQQNILEELQKVAPGTGATSTQQMAVMEWAAQYADHYFYDRHGALRHVFPKKMRVRLLRKKR